MVPDQPGINQERVDNVAEKLRGFYDALPDEEKEVLDSILVQAAQASDVEAYAIKQGFPLKWQGASLNFAKLGDIKGESTDDKHKGELDLLVYPWRQR